MINFQIFSYICRLQPEEESKADLLHLPLKAVEIEDEDSEEEGSTGNGKEVRWGRENDKALFEAVKEVETATGKSFDIVSLYLEIQVTFFL